MYRTGAYRSAGSEALTRRDAATRSTVARQSPQGRHRALDRSPARYRSHWRGPSDHGDGRSLMSGGANAMCDGRPRQRMRRQVGQGRDGSPRRRAIRADAPERAVGIRGGASLVRVGARDPTELATRIALEEDQRGRSVAGFPRYPAAPPTETGRDPGHRKNWLSTVPETGLTTTRSRNGTLDAQIGCTDIEPVAAVLVDFKSPTTATHRPNQPAGQPIGARSYGAAMPLRRSGT